MTKIHNWIQDYRINNISLGETERNKLNLQGLQKVFEQIDDKLSRLALINHAMWELLKQTHGFEEKKLLLKMQELDLLDGKRDGKLRFERKECESCGRKLNKRRGECLYCGEKRKIRSVFETLE